MTGNDARSQATPQRARVWSAQKQGPAPATTAQGKIQHTEVAFAAEGVRLMKHRISILLQLKQKVYLLATALQWKPGKLNVALKRKNCSELSSLPLCLLLSRRSFPLTHCKCQHTHWRFSRLRWVLNTGIICLPWQLQQRLFQLKLLKCAPIIAGWKLICTCSSDPKTYLFLFAAVIRSAECVSRGCSQHPWTVSSTGTPCCAGLPQTAAQKHLHGVPRCWDFTEEQPQTSYLIQVNITQSAYA